MTSSLSWPHAPKPETLAEFSDYNELIKDGGKGAISLQDALVKMQQREATHASYRPPRHDSRG